MEPAITREPPGKGGRRFGALVGYNGLTQLAPMLVALVLTPVIIHRIGVDRFGVWSLTLIAIGTLTSLDGGISASLTRFFAVHRSHGAARDSSRLLLASLLVFAAFGAVTSGLAYVVAPLVVPHLHIPPEIRPQAVTVFRWLPAVATLGLVGDAAVALLQGGGKFRAAAGATIVSNVVFLAVVLAEVHRPADLPKLLVATAFRYAALAVAGFWLARGQLAVGFPLLPARAEVRELGRYASRMQLASLVGFVNAELDGFVIAAVSPVRYVALYGVGLQLASAARSVPLYAFSPLLTRLTAAFGRGGRVSARAEYESVERVWAVAVFAYGAVAIPAAVFMPTLWLGHGYRLSGAAAAILLGGYVVHVGLTGARTCYVRAIGRPGLEARYSAVWTVLNAVSTVPLALVAGMLGVVGATAITGVVASVYFVRLCRREEELPTLLPGLSWWLHAVPAVAVTAACEWVILQGRFHGVDGLATACVPPAVVLALWVGLERRSSIGIGRLRIS